MEERSEGIWSISSLGLPLNNFFGYGTARGIAYIASCMHAYLHINQCYEVEITHHYFTMGTSLSLHTASVEKHSSSSDSFCSWKLKCDPSRGQPLIKYCQRSC